MKGSGRLLRTRFAVDILGLEVLGLEQREGENALAGVIAQRGEQLATFVLGGGLQRLPEGRFLRQVNLWEPQRSIRKGKHSELAGLGDGLGAKAYVYISATTVAFLFDSREMHSFRQTGLLP